MYKYARTILALSLYVKIQSMHNIHVQSYIKTYLVMPSVPTTVNVVSMNQQTYMETNLVFV